MLAETHWKPGLAPASQLALKFYAFGTEVLFSFLMLLWSMVEEKIPYVQQTPDLWSSRKIFALCLKLLKREKEISLSLNL